MDCPECAALEATRYECIKRYVDLMEVRKNAGENGDRSPGLNDALASAEFKLNQAWNRLEQHRRNHASIRATA
jgi:hypothetical protein